MVAADRVARGVVRPVADLAHTAERLGAGDLDARVEPAGPPEIVEVGHTLNRLAGRIVELLAAERELVADLSHRLRTPITALRLDAEALGPTSGSASGWATTWTRWCGPSTRSSPRPAAR